MTARANLRGRDGTAKRGEISLSFDKICERRQCETMRDLRFFDLRFTIAGELREVKMDEGRRTDDKGENRSLLMRRMFRTTQWMGIGVG